MTIYRYSNTAKGAKDANNDFHNLYALCVLCGELFGNEATNIYLHIKKISKSEMLDALEKLARIMWLSVDVYEDVRKTIDEMTLKKG